MDVGEVGRVLLSVTMCGVDEDGHNAAKRVLFVHAPSMIELPTTTPPNETKRKKKHKKKKTQSALLQQQPEPFPPTDDQALQDLLRLEIEKFLDLAGEREFIVYNVLDRLKAQNAALERLRADSSGGDGPFFPQAAAASSSKRWVTPRESGYHSDSESVSTTATQDDAQTSPVKTSTASLYLRGRAQERVLLQARDAISRAATLCQVLNDPRNPGSLERKDDLIRAFRAITMTDM